MSKNLSLEIASRLKIARKQAGFKSAKAFSLAHNIPLSTYSQHETGSRSLCAELIIHYSEVLQIDPYWLLTGIEPISREKKNHNGADIADAIAFLKMIFLSAEPLFQSNTAKMSFSELIDYCLELFAVISTLTVAVQEKEKIIDLTISSLKRGISSPVLVDKKVL
jgi:hypothetical protein